VKYLGSHSVCHSTQHSPATRPVLAMGVTLLFVLSVLAGCEKGSEHGALPVPVAPGRHQDAAELTRGAQLYSQHCARCHGAQAEGHPQWRQPGPDGLYPAPPLDGSGHAWHHPALVLREVIQNGSVPGQGNMPAWKDTLSEPDINAIIAWFQSLWSDDVYAAWYEMQQRGR
jgi:mono/diheme cytochrome c family protein